ncbi:MAG: cell division protein FtsZ [Chthoniobacterales bacterium]|nr:cell division protein FtsZ [Chthoniobacterales bacterium]
MIQLSRNYSLPEREDELIPIKVIGVGGAGSNALDRVVLDGLDKADLIAINTDVQALASSVAAHKVQLGRNVTRGLGAGGDPELGQEAAQEASDEIRQALADARMVFVCAGLGGGTGSGAAPLVAQLARDAGSLVIAFATMPFSFEGKRRAAQANEALARLHKSCDAVICFENDRMGDMVAPKAGIHQAFAAADVTISQSVRSIVNLLQRPGLIRIGFDDLLSALRSANGRCLFGFGEADSDNRAHDALTHALKNPLMDRGRMLAEAEHVLVQVAGGPGMTLSEVEILMGELGRHIKEHTQILFGTSVDGRMGNRLSVTIITSLAAEVAPVVEQAAPAQSSRPERRREPEPAPPPVTSNELDAEEPIAEAAAIVSAEIPVQPMVEQKVDSHAQEIEQPGMEPAELIVEPESILIEEEPPPRVIPPKRKPITAKEPKAPSAVPPAVPIVDTPAPQEAHPVREKVVHAKQEVLQFEAITRGRFEKSEPTIVEGQDLDVPTFLRKNVRVK